MTDKTRRIIEVRPEREKWAVAIDGLVPKVFEGRDAAIAYASAIRDRASCRRLSAEVIVRAAAKPRRALSETVV